MTHARQRAWERRTLRKALGTPTFKLAGFAWERPTSVRHVFFPFISKKRQKSRIKLWRSQSAALAVPRRRSQRISSLSSVPSVFSVRTFVFSLKHCRTKVRRSHPSLDESLFLCPVRSCRSLFEKGVGRRVRRFCLSRFYNRSLFLLEKSGPL